MSFSGVGLSSNLIDLAKHSRPAVASSSAVRSCIESPMEIVFFRHASSNCEGARKKAPISLRNAKRFQWIGDCGRVCSYVERADNIFIPSSNGKTPGRNFEQLSSTHPFSPFVIMMTCPSFLALRRVFMTNFATCASSALCSSVGSRGPTMLRPCCCSQVEGNNVSSQSDNQCDI